MIAGIDERADLDIYLTAEEVTILSSGTLEGVLVKTKTPKKQGTIAISINNQRNRENGANGIGLDDSKYWTNNHKYLSITEGFHLAIFLGHEWYDELKKEGKIGTRHSMRDGSKINVYDLSRLDYIDRSNAETLEFYRDNKDQLFDTLG